MFADSTKSWQGRELHVASAEVHPQYAEGQMTNDLAVIRLAPGQVDYKTPACLPISTVDSYKTLPGLKIGGFGLQA